MNYRIGIDVGGTFTHGVVLDNRTLEIKATACVPTTHTAPNGVAEGVGQCLGKLIENGEISNAQIAYIAHSTTQATNALLEGDVAAVGLIGLIGGISGWKARREMKFNAVPIGGSGAVDVTTYFCRAGEMEKIGGVLNALSEKRVKVIVAAQPFSVENPSGERAVIDEAAKRGFLTTATHQISGLYGLRARTRTAIVNAAILPKMMEAATRTYESMERRGLRCPLMIMRSDGGVMDIGHVRQNPIETLLSGPAAGVSAAILHERLGSGVFVEVGGTSTDISLVLNGRPMRKNAVVGEHVLYLKTLDVRTVGAAGGSMPRVGNNKLIDVGPRSAHIAGLGYACFQPPEEMEDAKMELIAPLPGDTADYAVVRTGAGKRVAVTATCAANMLGLVPEGDYARGNAESARLAMRALAKAMGKTEEETAREMIQTLVEKIHRRVAGLLKEYKAGEEARLVVGGGGGAAVLVPALAQRLGFRYRQARNAEIISAVGVGLALTKSTIEKSIVNPAEDDIKRIRSEAIQAVVDQGCDPSTVEVHIEVDTKKNVVRAEAEGASALVSGRAREKISPEEARRTALSESALTLSDVRLVFQDEGTYVFEGRKGEKAHAGQGGKAIIVVDAYGLLKLTVREGKIFSVNSQDAEKLQKIIAAGLHYGDGGVIVKPIHLIYGGKVIETSHLGSPEKILAFVKMEIADNPAREQYCLVVTA
ncbi:MAG: hydantoinase/oxoprolinase family protein [bacterium]